MTLDEIDDELDILMLRREKLQMLVLRLRAIHLKMTRRRKYWPVIKQGDSALEVAYTSHYERAAWQGKPKPPPRKPFRK